jgi:hypothetical protein
VFWNEKHFEKTFPNTLWTIWHGPCVWFFLKKTFVFCVLGVGRLRLHMEYGLMQDVMSVTYEKCHQDQK